MESNIIELKPIVEKIPHDFEMLELSLKMRGFLTNVQEISLRSSIYSHQEQISERGEVLTNIASSKKFYRMNCHLESNGCSYDNTYYIYPYQYVEENGCLFGLFIGERHYKDDYFNLNDAAINMDRFLKYNVQFTEITKDEFFKLAHEHIEETYNYRINRELQKEHKN